MHTCVVDMRIQFCIICCNKRSIDQICCTISYLYSRNGYAVMALKNGEIAAACGVYAPADGQWEVEIDTHPAFRRHGLAAACGAKFLLHCIRMEKVPHWDAMTPVSLSLAEKLGFQNPRPYRVVCREGEESIGYFAE